MPLIGLVPGRDMRGGGTYTGLFNCADAGIVAGVVLMVWTDL